jgi:phosphate transport system substrate-binding protein
MYTFRLCHNSFQYIGIVFLIFFSACGTDFKQPYSDTPTSGSVTVSADETMLPLAKAEQKAFMGLYRYADITLRSVSETECFNDLLKDTSKVIFASRKLNASEEKFFKQKNLVPVTTKVAIDALALVIHPENPDSLLTLAQLKQILTGEITDWNQINPQHSGKISFVFDRNGSSTVRFLKDSITGQKEFSENCFAAKGNEAVADYVVQNKNAIGIVGVAWISDSDDKESVQFRNKIKVMWLAANENARWPDDYFQPYQAYIALKQYPLLREIYMISREGRAGLGTGFVSFVAGDAGQRIIRLSGLLPATMPVRIIQNSN